MFDIACKCKYVDERSPGGDLVGRTGGNEAGGKPSLNERKIKGRSNSEREEFTRGLETRSVEEKITEELQKRIRGVFLCEVYHSLPLEEGVRRRWRVSCGRQMTGKQGATG